MINFSSLLNTSNLVNVFGAGLLILGGSQVIVKYILPHLSTKTVELCLYGIGTALATNKFWLPKYYDISEQGSYMLSIPGQFMLPLTFLYTNSTHKLGLTDNVLKMIISLFFSGQAICYQSQFLGVGAVAAMLSYFGAIYGAVPHCIYFGADSNALVSLCHVSGLLSFGYALLQINGLTNSPYLLPFKTGCYVGGLFTYYLTSLTLSDYWYHSGYNFKLTPYLLNNGITFGSMLLGYYLGNAYGLVQVQSVSQLAFSLFCIEKYFDISWGENIYFAITGLGAFLCFGPVFLRESIVNSLTGLSLTY